MAGIVPDLSDNGRGLRYTQAGLARLAAERRALNPSEVGRSKLTRRRVLLGIAAAALLVLAALAAKQLFVPPASSVLLVSPDGTARAVSLGSVDEAQRVTWDADGVPSTAGDRMPLSYTGVPLSVLLAGAEYAVANLVRGDGTAVPIARTRIENVSDPLVLVFACNGIQSPRWDDGPQVLIQGGGAPGAEAVDRLPLISGVAEIRLLPEEAGSTTGPMEGASITWRAQSIRKDL
jgi:hypothetical protein